MHLHSLLRRFCGLQNCSLPAVYAIKHGVLRGAYGGLSDEVAVDIKVPVDVSSIDEGAHSFVQSTTCRREVLTKIYGNKKAGKCQSSQ